MADMLSEHDRIFRLLLTSRPQSAQIHNALSYVGSPRRSQFGITLLRERASPEWRCRTLSQGGTGDAGVDALSCDAIGILKRKASHGILAGL
jgi:hypothetical protein